MIIQQHQYQLAKRGKWICPECGHKTFVCYVDANGNILDERVGKCDRADNCAYHYPPRQYFADNKLIGEGVPQRRPSRPMFRPQPRPTFIDPDIFKQSVTATMSRDNNLVEYLKSVFGMELVNNMVREYYIGTSRHFGGASTVFWQVDRYGKIRRGKIMQYNPTNGKRVKVNGRGLVNTVHSLMNLDDTLPKMCLFGEHLLPDNPDLPIAIVESEKTAIILSGVCNDCIPMACGGCGNLTAAMCEPLRGRHVMLFPDNGKFDEWSQKGKALRHIFSRLQISTIMEHEALNTGDDIGDLILQRLPEWKANNITNVDVYKTFVDL